MILKRFVLRGHAFGALIVVVSTLIGPIAEVRWGTMMLESFDHELYFVWGVYSLLGRKVITYDSLMNPIEPSNIFLLITFWLLCGVVLTAIMLYSSLEKHRLVIVGLGLTLVLILQIVLPFIMLTVTLFHVYPGPPHTWAYVLTSFPIPTVLAIAVQAVLYRIRGKSL